MSNPVQDAPVDPQHQKEAVCQSIRANAAFTAPYATMNTLATIVACYGLLQNSTAVVIGAMIIAMLLGPISGIALALVSGDNPLLRRALAAEVGGALVVLAVAFCIGKAHQDMPLTQEILARTSPNILDLMIALAGGAAGAYATVSPRLSVGLVGVAIATALVPPLSVCSICLARGESRLAFGGFLLFFANLVAIQFASSVVLLLHGYHKISRQAIGRRQLAERNGLTFGLLVGLTGLLGYDFFQSLAKQSFETNVRHTLEGELRGYPGVHLADLRFQRLADKEIVTAVLRTPYSFAPERVAALETHLIAPKGLALELHIRSVITKEATRAGYLHELPQPPADDTDKIGQ